ncbi:MAG: O-antigen ligase [Gammaproteobacteria bacterium]
MIETATNVPAQRETSAVKYACVLLIFSCIVLLPFHRLVEIPVLVMAAAGIVVLVRHRTELLLWPQMRTLSLVFAAMWLPIVISLPDAINPERTAVVAINHLRFFFSAVFMIWVLADARARSFLLTLVGCLLAFWLIDAGVQALLGVDLLGREKAGAHISGLYGPTSRKLGTTLGVIAPLLWVFVQCRFNAWLLLAVMLASALVVMAAGARAGWLSLLVCACVFVWFNRGYIRALQPGLLASAALLVLLLPVFAYFTSPTFQARLDESVGELSGQVDIQSSPLGHRAYIWKGAALMIADNPINGVGARGFRYAFADYAAPGDPFVAQVPPVLPMHSHQLLIEITAETGLIGLVGLLLALGVMLRSAWLASPQVRAEIMPYGIALCAAFFPLNTHLAIYSAHWSQIVWWLIGVFCACLAAASASADRAPSNQHGRA